MEEEPRRVSSVARWLGRAALLLVGVVVLLFLAPWALLLVLVLSPSLGALSNPALHAYAGAFLLTALLIWLIWRRWWAALGAGIAACALVGWGVPFVWNLRVRQWEPTTRWTPPQPIAPARTVALQGSPHALGSGGLCSDLCLLLLYTRQADAVWQLPGDLPPSAGQLAADPPNQIHQPPRQFRLGGLAACEHSELQYRQTYGPGWLDTAQSRLVQERARKRMAAEECLIAEQKPVAAALTIRWRERWEDRMYAEPEQAWEHALELEVAGRVVAREARHRRIYYATPLAAEFLYRPGWLPGGSKWRWRSPDEAMPPIDATAWLAKNTNIRFDTSAPIDGRPAPVGIASAASAAGVRERLDRRMNTPGAPVHAELIAEYFQTIQTSGLRRADLPRLWRLLRSGYARDLSQWPHQRLMADPAAVLLRAAILFELGESDLSDQQWRQRERLALSLPPGSYGGSNVGLLQMLDRSLAQPGMAVRGQRLRERRREPVMSLDAAQIALRACFEELPAGETTGLEASPGNDWVSQWRGVRGGAAQDIAGGLCEVGRRAEGMLPELRSFAKSKIAPANLPTHSSWLAMLVALGGLRVEEINVPPGALIDVKKYRAYLQQLADNGCRPLKERPDYSLTPKPSVPGAAQEP